MFDAVSDLKRRLELVATDFYEKWHMQDHCDYFVPEGTILEEFLANQAKEREEQIPAVRILETLKKMIDAVPHRSSKERQNSTIPSDMNATAKLLSVSSKRSALGSILMR